MTVVTSRVPQSRGSRPAAKLGRISRTDKNDAATEGGRRSTRQQPLTGQSKRPGLHWSVTAFLVGLFLPWIIPLGPLNLSVYRIVLLMTLVPCLVLWVRGRAGRIRIADITILLFSLWTSVSLAVVHGVQHSIEAIGIGNIETLGAYFLARCYIRSAEHFRSMVQLVCRLIMMLLPFALYEWVSGQKPLLVLFGYVFPTVDVTMMDPRWGFWRVQGPFEHSIVYGLFCGSLVALAYLVLGYGKAGIARFVQPAVVSFTAFVSMSSAPIAGIALLIGLMLWNSLFRGFNWRWKILWAIAFLGYIFVAVGSNQTPVQFYISHFTFDAQTGWYRLLIWQCGSDSVAKHPLFGIGMGDWVRLPGMGSSVDNFWLLIAMRYGIPAVLLIFSTCIAVIGQTTLAGKLPDEIQDYRTGYLISLIVFMLVGCTVHFWAAIYVWFVFLLGSGAWILEVTADGVATRDAPTYARERPSKGQRWSREQIIARRHRDHPSLRDSPEA